MGFCGWSFDSNALTNSESVIYSEGDSLNNSGYENCTVYAIWLTTKYSKTYDYGNKTFNQNDVLKEDINPNFDLAKLKELGYTKIDFSIEIKYSGYHTWIGSNLNARVEVRDVNNNLFGDNYYVINSDTDKNQKTETKRLIESIDLFGKNGYFRIRYSTDGKGDNNWHLYTVTITMNVIQ